MMVTEEMVELAAKAIAENHWSVDSHFMKAVHVNETWIYHVDDARDALIAALSQDAGLAWSDVTEADSR